MPLEEYNFIREDYQPDDIEFLMGNGEMGGWVSKDGLGFEKMWFTDVWLDSETRMSLPGPKLILENEQIVFQDPLNYKTELNIRNGILTTSVELGDGTSYTSKVFLSIANKHQLVIHVKNRSQQTYLRCGLLLPCEGFIIEKHGVNQLVGTSRDEEAFTKMAWAITTGIDLEKNEEAFSISIAPNQSVTLRYSLVTHYDSKEYKAMALKNSEIELEYDQLAKEQVTKWNDQWLSSASVILPDGENAKWFYRSLYTLYATAGADHFLPGELQFSIPDVDWKMHHFTYGHAGWSVWAFALMGDKEHAKKMARWHYKPEALRENVKILFPETGPTELLYNDSSKGVHTYLEAYNPDAIAFGHEVTTAGYNIPSHNTKHWDLQRQLDAFAASLFHIIYHLYPEEDFLTNYTYPVMRGTAEMWSSLVKWDSLRRFYYLPPLLSVSENIIEQSVLDAVLAARWNLKMSALYAQKLNRDVELQEKWQHIYNHLYIPRNDTIYLEYLDEKKARSGGGYFGIRAYMYLGFPVLENIPDIDVSMARKSLDITWDRNRQGEGMITFISNWFALTEAYLGFGNNAYELSRLATRAQDPSGVALYEAMDRKVDGSISGINPYFLTGYSSFILTQLAMLLQSFNDNISVFPAVPDKWEDIEFYDLPAQGGVRVSAVMHSGKVRGITFKKDGKEILKLDEATPVHVTQVGEDLILRKTR